MQKGPTHPRWRDGRYIDGHGYVKIWQGSPGRYEREHRLVMQEVLGRPLRRDEVVHHKNGDKADNRPENLELLTHSTHAKEHHVERAALNLPPRPALACHPERPHHAKGKCRQCYMKEAQADWDQRNREKRREHWRRYDAKRPNRVRVRSSHAASPDEGTNKSA